MPATTNKPSTLAEALAILQTRLPHIGKDSAAIVPTKSGGAYGYKYADLATITKAIMPILGELGLSFVTFPSMFAGDRFVLKFSLRHEDGDEVDGEYPLPDPVRSTPQQIGSAITYARRYCLCAVTGVAPDEDDDDGQEASAARLVEEARAMRRKDPEVDATGAATRAEITRMSTGPEPGTVRGPLPPVEDLWATGPSGLAPEVDPEDLHGTCTADQIRSLQAAFTVHGIGAGLSETPKRAAKIAWLVERFGPDIHSSKDLSYTQAAQALQELNQ